MKTLRRMTRLLHGPILVLTLGQVANARYDETLPPGVRLLVYKNIQTDTIQNRLGDHGQDRSMSFKEKIDAKSLEKVEAARPLVEEVKAQSQTAFNELLLGEYELDASAKVKVHGFGFAWGLTERMTLYSSIGFYRADVAISANRTAGNNYQKIANILADENSSLEEQAMAQTIQNMMDVNGEVLQSILVDQYGYGEIGSWRGEGFGDLDLALKYRFYEKIDFGSAFTLGVTLPTGREDDPDLLQDFSFGDGQTDLYAEIGFGLNGLKGKFELNSSLRYTYQMASEKELRAATDPDFPLTEEKLLFEEKLGNMIGIDIDPGWHFSDWVSLFGHYMYRYRGESVYKSSNEAANQALATRTEQVQHFVGASLSFSTVKPYLSKKFKMPFVVTLHGRRVMTGRNTPQYTRGELEFRVFF